MQKKEERIIFNIDKEKNFSRWFTEIVKIAELADLRYNVKGFVVFQPWSVLAMEKMHKHFEKVLQKKGHKPYWFPTVIPQRNFKLLILITFKFLSIFLNNASSYINPYLITSPIPHINSSSGRVTSLAISVITNLPFYPFFRK